MQRALAHGGGSEGLWRGLMLLSLPEGRGEMKISSQSASQSVGGAASLTAEEHLSPLVQREDGEVEEEGESEGTEAIDPVRRHSPHSLRHLLQTSGGRAVQLYMPIRLSRSPDLCAFRPPSVIPLTYPVSTSLSRHLPCLTVSAPFHQIGPRN